MAKKGKEAPKVRKMTAEELVAEIARILKTWDGEWLKDTANEILGERVEYDGDSTFTVTPRR